MPPIDDAGYAALNQPAPDMESTDLASLDFGNTMLEDEPEEAPEAPVAAEVPSQEEEADTPPNQRDTRPNNFIPKHRFNFAQQKRREAEERAAALEAELKALKESQPQQNAQPTREQYMAALDQRINQLDHEIEMARIDNDAAKVAELRAQQRNFERQLIKLETPPPPDPKQFTKHTVEQMRTTSTIAELEKSFPFLDESSPHFNGPLSDEVMDTFDYFSTKMPRDEALRRATYYVLGAHGLLNQSAAAVARAKPNVQKNVRAAASQPPPLANAGFDGNKGGATRKLDVMQMTQEDFERLGDKEMAELLGNYDV